VSDQNLQFIEFDIRLMSCVLRLSWRD